MPLRVALGIVAAEAVAFVVLGGAELFSLSTERLAMGVSTALFFIAWGAVLAVCAAAMARGHSTGRSVVVLGQLIQLGLAWSYRESAPELAGVLGLSAIVALGGIFARKSLAWFEED